MQIMCFNAYLNTNNSLALEIILFFLSVPSAKHKYLLCLCKLLSYLLGINNDYEGYTHTGHHMFIKQIDKHYQ